jgi:histidinol-phosphatase (PHP family)
MKHGGRFALSDDSHGPQSVGLNYRRTAEYGRQLGVNELWYLEASAAGNGRGRPVHAVRVDKWWDCDFWKRE